MKIIFRIILALALLPLTASPSGASAPLTDHIVISELQTASTANASEEFVELYNPTPLSVPLDGWSIEYKSATSSIAEASWSKKATLAGTIEPGGFYLVGATAFFSSGDAGWSSTLAASAGHIRLLDEHKQVIDKLGYGSTANTPETAAAPAPAAGQSIERLPGRLDELAGNAVDTDDNAADFIIRAVPGPQTRAATIEQSQPTPPEADPELPTQPDTTEAPAPLYPALAITELLVDPLAPLTDADDEFVELYNPSSDPVSLAGYVLKCGSDFRDYYVLTDQLIQPGGYLAIYAKQSKLALTNSGGAAQLFDPSGVLVDQTADYGTALAGQTWAKFENGWQWTLQVTPGQPNVLASLPATIVATKTVAKPLAKKTAVKAAPKPKKVSIKAAKVKKPKKPKKIKAKNAVFTAQPAAAKHNLQPAGWLIISLAVLTIGYAIYEFRLDLHSLYYRIRGNHLPREANRRSVEGRRNG